MGRKIELEDGSVVELLDGIGNDVGKLNFWIREIDVRIGECMKRLAEAGEDRNEFEPVLNEERNKIVEDIMDMPEPAIDMALMCIEDNVDRIIEGGKSFELVGKRIDIEGRDMVDSIIDRINKKHYNKEKK